MMLSVTSVVSDFTRFSTPRSVTCPHRIYYYYRSANPKPDGHRAYTQHANSQVDLYCAQKGAREGNAPFLTRVRVEGFVM